MQNRLVILVVLLTIGLGCLESFAQQKRQQPAGIAKISEQEQQENDQEKADDPESDNELGDEKEKLYQQFEATMSGAKLVGNFTITGQDNSDLEAEEYEIKSVKKLAEGDLWLINARVKYSGRDVTVPMPLEVKWAGDTPVITLTDLDIPLLGKFSARVIVYNGKYAGTWSHGDFGGHLFGKVHSANSEADEQEE